VAAEFPLDFKAAAGYLRRRACSFTLEIEEIQVWCCL
jgi:hypothetical protein